MAYGGMQINGAMEVSQERGTTVGSASGIYPCDGWQQSFGGTMTVNTAIAGAAFVPGFTNVLYLNPDHALLLVGTSQAGSLQRQHPQRCDKPQLCFHLHAIRR